MDAKTIPWFLFALTFSAAGLRFGFDAAFVDVITGFLAGHPLLALLTPAAALLCLAGISLLVKKFPFPAQPARPLSISSGFWLLISGVLLAVAALYDVAQINQHRMIHFTDLGQALAGVLAGGMIAAAALRVLRRRVLYPLPAGQAYFLGIFVSLLLLVRFTGSMQPFTSQFQNLQILFYCACTFFSVKVCRWLCGCPAARTARLMAVSGIMTSVLGGAVCADILYLLLKGQLEGSGYLDFYIVATFALFSLTFSISLLTSIYSVEAPA